MTFAAPPRSRPGPAPPGALRAPEAGQRGSRHNEKHPVHTRRVFFSKVLKVLKDVSVSITTKVMDYFLLHSFGVTQVPVALATTIGSSRTSAAEALMSGLAAITFLASNFIFLEVLPTLVISP